MPPRSTSCGKEVGPITRPDADDVQSYFTHSAVTFDALYAEGQMNPLERFINQRFRRDIYQRFVLTMDHVQRYRLQSALDVGCGSGRYAVRLLEMGLQRVLGVDFSPSMIELARRHVGAVPEADRRCELRCVDFAHFDTDETFDVVIAMGLFDYLPDPLPVLQKMKRMARHSVLASFPSISFYRTPLRKLRYRLKRCPVYFYDRPRLRQLQTGSAFARHEVTKIEGAGMDYFVAFFR